MKSLTKREKILLYILACVIIFSASLKFLILPSVENLNDVKTQVNEAKLKELEMQAKIKNIKIIEDNISKTTVEINSLSSEYYPLMPNEEIDKLITVILEKYNMIPTSLNISEPLTKKDESNNHYIKKRIVSAQANGNLLALGNIIEDVSKRGSMKISSFNIDDSYSNVEQIISISIDFEVYMYDSAQK